MNNQPKPSLTEINDKLLAGKVTLEQSEIDDLIINLRIELGRAVSGNQLIKEQDVEQWNNIFSGLFTGELSNPFMENMDKDLFFCFWRISCFVIKSIE
ncbi:MAG: hypothetical protein MZV64_35330 [Ignavibacteriales bacterium]|nr:hypothetical protein [Ignavibacteriales bacterium]